MEQAVQPLITEITILKGKLEETDNRVRKLEKEVMELKDEKAQQSIIPVPSQHLTPFLDMWGWLKDTIDRQFSHCSVKFQG